MSAYDTIIIGAGSAGCVLANRLSEDPNRTVLLIEAGPQGGHIYMRMPAAVAMAIKSPRFNWHYQTTPQKHMNDRQISTPRGKALGGSSAINALVYVRGNAYDYNNWAAMGCPGWGYDDVLHYFRAAENNAFGPGAFHGTEGPLVVSHPESENLAYKAFVEAGVEMGYPYNPDNNGATQEGFGPFQLNIKDGRRWSSANAFLHPIADRKNLTIRTDQQVLGLQMQGTKVTGVKLAQGRDINLIHAKTVVLSAGSIGSPHLMMLSGIGPADHLRQHAIKVAMDLPGVGQNLHDHLEVKVKFRMTKPLSLWRHMQFPNYLIAGAQYLFTGTGVCRQQGLEAGAFLSLDPKSPAPDTQLHFINALAFDGATADDRGHGFAIDTTQTRPESRGSLTLASSDPHTAPLIDPNYLSEDKDRVMMREGLKILRELCAQPALAALCGDELRPGVALTTNAQLDEVVRNTADSIYHPVGTARMGSDDMAVVDPGSMAVHGTQGLFVADASIMPQLVSGNTNAASIMIGAKGSDLILNQVG
jgi:choline dehydrogenase